jgi:hypothetical protein
VPLPHDRSGDGEWDRACRSSTLLVRGGISRRPLGGDEPTTAIAYLGLARDL